MVQRHVGPEDGRRHLGVGAVGVVSPLLARRGEGAVESQGAVRRGRGDGVGGGVLRDVAHGLGAGQRAVVAPWGQEVSQEEEASRGARWRRRSQPGGWARLWREKACRCCHSYSCHMVSSRSDLLFSAATAATAGRRARSYTEPDTLQMLSGLMALLRGSVR